MEKPFEVKMKLTGKIIVVAKSFADAQKQVQEMNELDVIDEIHKNGKLEVMYISDVIYNDPEDFI